MKRFASRAAGLGSRVALRTFLLFAVCAMAPVALFALLGHAFVRDEMRAAAVAQLDSTSKRHGVLIYERLNEVRGSSNSSRASGSAQVQRWRNRSASPMRGSASSRCGIRLPNRGPDAGSRS